MLRLAAAMAAVSLPAMVAAQQRVPVAVGSSERAAFQAEGLPLGGFRVYPTVRATIAYDDNIFLRRDKVQDTFVTTALGARAQSQWSVHSLALDAFLTDHRYLRRGTLNNDEYGVSTDGRLDIARTLQAIGSASYARRVVARGTPEDLFLSNRPLKYDVATVSAGLTKSFNKVSFTGSGQLSRINYKSISDGGVFYDQSFRDRTSKAVTGRVDYAISPAISVFGLATYSIIDYRNVGSRLNRSSNGLSFLGGVRFEITRLLTGEIAVGYLKQDFDDSRFNGFNGINYNANVTYRPTELTTLRFTASRSLRDSALVAVGGVLTSQVGLVVEHELLRNLLLRGQAQYYRDKYRGLPLNSDRLELGAGVRYQMNKYLSLAASYDRSSRTRATGLAGSRYTGNRVSLSLIAQR